MKEGAGSAKKIISDSNKKTKTANDIDRTNISLWTDHFDKLSELGKGTYAVVWKVKEIKTGAQCALKRLTYDAKEDRFVSREIKSMQKLRGHPNIVQLLGIYRDFKDHLVLQMELCTGGNFANLLSAAENGGRSVLSCLGAAQIKAYIQQLLLGMDHMHKNNIIHRDLKPENLLLQGTMLKIADFGLCKEQNPDWQKYSPNLQTLWYRAPEMCLGFTSYNAAVDMWSFGCIMGEFIYGTAILPGRGSELRKKDDKKEHAKRNGKRQLDMIYQLCGTPNIYEWHEKEQPAVRASFNVPKKRTLISAYIESRNYHKRKSFITEQAINLLDAVLQLHPSKRLIPADALKHPYFTQEYPKPYIQPEMLHIPEARIPKVKKRLRKD
jgi:serine/threonine protein kinase